MTYFTFVFINFIVSFLSDIVLNDIASGKTSILQTNIIMSLRPYFKEKSILFSAMLAGLTIAISILITSFFSVFLLGFHFPRNMFQLASYSVLAFGIGFIIDVLIDSMNLFGKSLKPYYRVAGAGLWGALAFLFSIQISYFLQNVFLPYLK